MLYCAEPHITNDSPFFFTYAKELRVCTTPVQAQTATGALTGFTPKAKVSATLATMLFALAKRFFIVFAFVFVYMHIASSYTLETSSPTLGAWIFHLPIGCILPYGLAPYKSTPLPSVCRQAVVTTGSASGVPTTTIYFASCASMYAHLYCRRRCRKLPR